MAIVHALTMWGFIVGLVAAAILTYIISLYLWGEFKVELFVGLSISFIAIGFLIQHKLENK